MGVEFVVLFYCLLCIWSDLVMFGGAVNPFWKLFRFNIDMLIVFPQFFTACSTVLVPARVVQALNLNLEEMMGAQPQLQPRLSGTLTPDGGIFLVAPISIFSAHLILLIGFYSLFIIYFVVGVIDCRCCSEA